MVKRYYTNVKDSEMFEGADGPLVLFTDYDSLSIHDKAATSFIDEIARALGWVREGDEEIVNLNDIRDEVLHWIEAGSASIKNCDGA